jgi:hypothetical protein
MKKENGRSLDRKRSALFILLLLISSVLMVSDQERKRKTSGFPK